MSIMPQGPDMKHIVGEMSDTKDNQATRCTHARGDRVIQQPPGTNCHREPHRTYHMSNNQHHKHVPEGLSPRKPRPHDMYTRPLAVTLPGTLSKGLSMGKHTPLAVALPEYPIVNCKLIMPHDLSY